MIPTITVGRMQRAVGCVIGSAVGDALGAPFEFGPAGQYSQRFPRPVHGGIGEMTGGGGFGWEPGQFTDDNEMAVLVAESLLASNGFDAEDQLARFRAWGASAKDVGVLTREVLDCELPASEAAEHVLRARRGRYSAGNGSIMRAATGAVHFAAAGRHETMAAGRRLSAVTHADPLCQWAVAIQHELIRIALDGGDPLDAIDEILALVPETERAVFAPILASSWGPDQDGPSNGSAMGALAQSVWAHRHNSSFARIVTAVIDLGDDTDSVAAVAGALAGARFGIQAIPSRWVAYVHGRVTGLDGTVRDCDHLTLQRLAMSLIGWPHPRDAPDEPALEPGEITPSLLATNRSGSRVLPDDQAVVSLCRIESSMRHLVRREVFLVDRVGDDNPSIEFAVDDALDSIDALLAEGREVVVHCHGGRSRTGLVLAAHLMRHGMSLAEAQSRLAEVWPHAHFRNPRFAGELQRRARWANMSDSLIARRLGAVPDDQWNELWRAFDAVGDEQARSTWRGGEQVSTTIIDGVEHPVISMPWVDYSDEVAHLSEQLSRAGVILDGFNWPDWKRQSPLRDAFRDGSTVDLNSLSFADAARLITAIVRSDRFSDGALAARLDDGSLFTLLQILRHWRPPNQHLT